MMQMAQNTEQKINVQLNGTTIAVDNGISLGTLLDDRGLERRMIAVEYNGEILPRHDYDSTIIHDGDALEIVHMVGGG